jgi:hypothetical protein
MATEKATATKWKVPLDLPTEWRMILRGRVETWRAGQLDDLMNTDLVKGAAREGYRARIAIYERLIEALRDGKMELPDDEAQAELKRAAEGFDDAEEWAEIKVEHDAMWAFVAATEWPKQSASSSDRERRHPAQAQLQDR